MKIHGIEVDVAYGTLTKNPDIVTEKDFKAYRQLVWIKYEGYWYISKHNLDKEQVINFITNTNTNIGVIDKILRLI